MVNTIAHVTKILPFPPILQETPCERVRTGVHVGAGAGMAPAPGRGGGGGGEHPLQGSLAGGLALLEGGHVVLAVPVAGEEPIAVGAPVRGVDPVHDAAQLPGVLTQNVVQAPAPVLRLTLPGIPAPGGGDFSFKLYFSAFMTQQRLVKMLGGGSAEHAQHHLVSCYHSGSDPNVIVAYRCQKACTGPNCQGSG